MLPEGFRAVMLPEAFRAVELAEALRDAVGFEGPAEPKKSSIAAFLAGLTYSLALSSSISELLQNASELYPDTQGDNSHLFLFDAPLPFAGRPGTTSTSESESTLIALTFPNFLTAGWSVT
jgi:hypothetical protein